MRQKQNEKKIYEKGPATGDLPSPRQPLAKILLKTAPTPVDTNTAGVLAESQIGSCSKKTTGKQCL